MLFSDNYEGIREAFVESNFDQDADNMRDLFDSWAGDWASLAYVQGATNSFLRRDLTLHEVLAKNPYNTGEGMRMWAQAIDAERDDPKLCNADIILGGTFYMCDRKGNHTIHTAEGEPQITWSES